MNDRTQQEMWAQADGAGEKSGGRKSDREKGGERKVRVRKVDREQMALRPIKVEALIEEDHPARAIWEMVGRLDLSGYYEPIRSVEGEAGRPNSDPQMLISVWLYALSTGEMRGREIDRLCEYHPAYLWLTGLQRINYHTLTDFRVKHKEALEELFVQVLGVLSEEGLITLERVMQDGTKVRANAGTDTRRREKTLREHLEEARELVESIEKEPEEADRRVAARRERARRERVERLELAEKELKKIQEGKRGEGSKEEARVSETDPESRNMKQGDGGYGPSYNAQVSTDQAHAIILGAGVSQSESDYGELVPGVKRVKKVMRRTPGQMVTDGGYTSRGNILAMKEEGVDWISPIQDGEEQRAGQRRRQGISEEYGVEAFVYEEEADRYRCPMGKELKYEGKERGEGVIKYGYRAQWSDCEGCPAKGKCCPKSEGRGRRITRLEESEEVKEFRAKMETEESKAIYRERGPISEFVNAWLKEKIGLRRFRLRGLVKVGLELLWACLAYNIQQWIRLRWRPAQAAAA